MGDSAGRLKRSPTVWTMIKTGLWNGYMDRHIVDYKTIIIIVIIYFVDINLILIVNMSC